MSKKSKTIKMQRIPMNQIDFDAFICGWAGCTNSAQANTPEAAGWKSVMITSGSFLVKENLYNADLDGMLCPEHFKKMMNFTKKGLLGPMVGNAPIFVQ